MRRNAKLAEKEVQKFLKNGKFGKAVDRCNVEASELKEKGEFEEAIEWAQKGVDIAIDNMVYYECSFCERTIAETYSLIGNRDETLMHLQKFEEMAEKCGDKSQIQLHPHVFAWCMMKLFNFGNATRSDLEKSVDMVLKSQNLIDLYEKEIVKKQEFGTIAQRKANLYNVEAQLHQLLGNNTMAIQVLVEGERLLGKKNRDNTKDSRYELMVTLCGLEAPENRLEIARDLVKNAPSEKKPGAMIEYSHQLILRGKTNEAYMVLNEVYCEFGRKILPDDLADVKSRLPILYKLKKYSEMMASHDQNGKYSIYETVADLYDQYYRMLSDTEKKEYTPFVKENIIGNYEQMISQKRSIEEEIRGRLAIALVFIDIDDFSNAIKNLEIRLKLLVPTNREKIMETKLLIFNCMCNIEEHFDVLQAIFEENERNVELDREKYELYTTWANYWRKNNNSELEGKFRKLAEDFDDDEENNSDDETDFLFGQMKDKTILILCADDYEECKKINKIRDPNELIKTNKHGETPLHEAAKENDWKKVELMCSLNYDVNARDAGGWTPLSEAVDHDQLENVKILIKYGADINSTSETGLEDLRTQIAGIGMNRAERHSITPLMNACCNGFISIAKYLIEKGANLEMRDSMKWTAYDHLRDFMETNGVDEEVAEFEEYFRSKMSSFNIPNIRRRIRSELDDFRGCKKLKIEKIPLEKDDDDDQGSLLDDCNLNKLEREIILDCVTSPPNPAELYKKMNDSIPEVIQRFEKLSEENCLDLSNLFLDSERFSKICQLCSSITNIASVSCDLSRCELKDQDERNLQKIVKSSKRLVLRATCSENGFTVLFHNEDVYEIENLECSVNSFVDHEQLARILRCCPMLKSLSLFSINFQNYCTLSPIPDVFIDLKSLETLDLKNIEWLDDKDLARLLGNLLNLKNFRMYDVKTNILFMKDWMPRLQELICRRCELSWFSFFTFLSFSNLKSIDLRGCDFDRSFLNDLRFENIST